MLGADHLEDVLEVGEEVVQAGVAHRVFVVQHLLGLLQGNALGDGHAFPAAQLLAQRFFGLLAFGRLGGVDQVAAIGIHLDHATGLGQLAQACIVEVARVVVDRLGRAVREHERHRHHRQQVIEHRIGRVRLVDDDAQLHRGAHQILAGRAQALPLRTLGVGGRIGELVVGEVHRAQQAQAGAVVEREQAGVFHQRAGVFHADVDHALAGGLDPRGIIGGQRQFEALGVGRQHLPDLQQPLQAMVAFGQVGRCSAVALVGVDRPEATIQRALDHARVIHLRKRVVVVPLFDVEAGAAEVGRRVEVAVQGQQALLQGLGAGQLLRAELDGMGGQRRAQRQGKQQGQATQRWHGLSPAKGRARP